MELAPPRRSALGALASWRRVRASGPLRAMALAGAWGVLMLPPALGWQRCSVAVLLHHPCPGCGMTRAVLLLLRGDVAGSLHMHPLAIPVLGVWLAFMASTVVSTWSTGTPFTLYGGRLGKTTLAAMVVVYALALLLWILRWFGMFGGPVPVY
jgi:hypothetical protein